MYAKYFVLFAILFTGWILRKTEFIDDKMDHSMNKLIVYFAYPCLIVHNIGTIELTQDIMLDFLLTFALSLVLFYLYGLFCKGYAKLRHFPEDVSGIAEFTMAMPNNGFMGFPIALIFFGEEGLLLMLAHNAAMNIFMFTYGVGLLRKMKMGDKQKLSFRRFLSAVMKLFLNPNILALIIGFGVSLMGRGLPSPVDEYLQYIGNISTPMAMIYIGATLSGYRFRDIISSRITIEGSIVKLIILPLLTVAAIYFLPIAPMIKVTLALGISFPAAAMVPMITEQEGLDPGASSKILFLSTVASIVTIPLFIQLFNFLFI